MAIGLGIPCLLIGLGLAYQLVRRGPASVSKDLFDTSTIRSLDKEADVAGAVGLVVCGVEYVGPDGTHGDVAISIGTCFAITGDGYLLTNRHVVEGIDKLNHADLMRSKLQTEKLIKIEPKIWIFFNRASDRPEKVVAEIAYLSNESEFDMAILKVGRSHRPFLRLSTLKHVSRNTPVVAIGYPAAAMEPISLEEQAERAVRQAKPSQIESVLKQRDFEFVRTNGQVTVDIVEQTGRHWIQHSASINPGNSGGPLATPGGLVLGINTQMIAGAEATFQAVAIDRMETIIREKAPGVIFSDR